MADAVLWQILNAVQYRLQNDLSFTTQSGDTVDNIATTSIVIKTYAPGRAYEYAFSNDEKPGIIISPAYTMPQDPFDGENLRDDIRYPVMVQIIDRHDGDRLRNLKSYLKWQEQIAKLLRNQQLLDSGGTCVAYTAYVTSQMTVNKSLFVQHDLMVAGVRADFMSRETRGAT